jgi:hypothetical protein
VLQRPYAAEGGFALLGSGDCAPSGSRSTFPCWISATQRTASTTQRAGHEQAMGVLLQPAIAHLGKTEHPLDDPD